MQPYYGNMSIKIPYIRKKIPSTLLLTFSAIVLLLLTSSPLLLLSPFTMSVIAQTETDAGDDDDDADDAATTSGATNDNTTTTTTTTAANTNTNTNTNATGNNNNNMTTGAKFLFIQSAQSGSVSEVNATTSTLELSDVSDKTILFSDRPDRIVSSVNTTDFIGNWSTAPDSFAVDPPNAVLILDDEEERQELAVIELFNPEYDSEANTLKYDITAVNATATTTTSIDLPSEFGQSTLVIDSDIPIGINGDDNTATATGDSSRAVAGTGDDNTATATGDSSRAVAGTGDDNTARVTGQE
jgi:hypothetical protein